MKWKELVVNQMLLVMIKKQANEFFMIVQRKVLKAAEMFVTTVKGRKQGNHLNLKITLLIWQLPWALSF
jgi:leucyl aminopeptidase (aminopeptidase T)